MFSFATQFVDRVWKSAVGWSFAVAALRLGGFLLVLPITLRKLSPDYLGLWYLFTAIGEFCWSAELGLGSILGRNASYFMAGVDRVPEHGLSFMAEPTEPRPANQEGLAGLLLLAHRSYLRIVVGIVIFLLTFGMAIVVYKTRRLLEGRTPALLAYGVFVLATALSVAGTYWPHFLAGIGQVRLSQRALLIGLVLNYGVTAAFLLLGFGIFALAFGQLILAVSVLLIARWQVLSFCPGLRAVKAMEIRFGEVWPATWRSLLTSVGGYLCCQSTLLVCGLISTLAVTASYGLSLRLALVAHGFAAVWLTVRQPHIARARAASDLPLVVALVRGSVPRCFATYFVGAVAISLVAPILLTWMRSQTPPLPLPLLAGLLLMVGLDFLVGFHLAVIQTSNRFPHLWIYLWSGLGAAVLAFTLGSNFGVAGIIAAPMLAQIVVAYWWIPRRCWQELRA